MQDHPATIGQLIAALADAGQEIGFDAPVIVSEEILGYGATFSPGIDVSDGDGPWAAYLSLNGIFDTPGDLSGRMLDLANEREGIVPEVGE